MRIISLTVALLLGYSLASVQHTSCRKKRDDVVMSSSKLTKLADVTPPEQWIWSNVNGTNYLTNLKNQHIPQYCGSCWAQAATSSLSDRIKIMRKAQWPDVNISPQVLLSCSAKDDGCDGGYAVSAYEWMHNNNITDETCATYRARGHTNGLECSALSMCKDCHPHEDCFIPPSYYVYRVGEYANITGEAAMVDQIYQKGPIACGIAVTQDLLNYKGGIFNDTTGATDIDHDISVVGYGVENGVKYWVVRNSWGTSWGESGFFRIVRGTNNLMIESDCAYAIPVDTWTNEEKHITTTDEQNDPKNKNDSSNGPYPEDSLFLQNKHSKGCAVKKTDLLLKEVKTQPMAWETVSAAQLPANWDWRNVNGTNYASWTFNQHIPIYCGSCWAQAATASLADRFNILLGDKNPTPVALNPQMIVNCQAGGSCNGGDPVGVYEYAYLKGLPDSTCEVYTAHNLQGKCGAMDICKDCRGPAPAADKDGQENCWPITNYKKYYVSDYYSFSGAQKMKAEIFKNGPISCGIDATDKMHNYAGGIYSEPNPFPIINHIVSVAGWGYDEASNTEYWIVRNSWGTYWGEKGWMKLKMHADNLAIETDCNGAIPTFTRANSVPQELIE